MAVAEGAAPRVLPGEAHCLPLEEQRREGEVLGCPPVDGCRGCSALVALLDELEHLRVRVEPSGTWTGASSVSRSTSRCTAVATSGTARVGAALVRLARRPPSRPASCGSRRRAPLRARCSRTPCRSCAICVGPLGAESPAGDEPLHVDLAHRRLLVDERVHERLREARLVALVVAVAAVAVHVDDDVLARTAGGTPSPGASPGSPPPGPRRSRGRRARFIIRVMSVQ